MLCTGSTLFSSFVEGSGVATIVEEPFDNAVHW